MNIDLLKEYFAYDSNTGIVTWIKNRGDNDIVGKSAGSLDSDGYICVKFGNKRIQAHRIAWALISGKWPTKDIDHINLVRNDNRLCNLREVSRSLNLHNSAPRKRNTSGHKGITYKPKGRRKWCAMVMINYKQHYIGVFDKVEEAVLARNEYCKKMLGNNYKID